MKQVSVLLSLAALALPTQAGYAILGNTADGVSASRNLDPPGGCFNFDDPSIIGDGDAAFVFTRVTDTYTAADIGAAGAWLYRGRDCHDDAPLFVDKDGRYGLNPPGVFLSCKLEAGK